MKRTPPVLRLLGTSAVALLALLAGDRRAADAYDLDVHYLWTYYLSLHAGFSERQAYQVASAAFAIDHDPQTGPLHAQAMDSIFGSETELFRSTEVERATREAAITGRDVIERMLQPLLDAQRAIASSPDSGYLDRLVAERAEKLLADLPNHSFLYGGTFEHWRDVRRPVIRNVWSHFHAFAESELLPAAVSRVEGEREERIDGYLFQVLWNYMPLWSHLFPEAFPPRLLEMEPGKFSILTDEAMAARDRNADYLWRLGLSEHNIGPFIHFLQDSFSHQEFDNIRGHATWGHRPDFLSDDVAKSQRMTLATLHTLCRFRDAVVRPHLAAREGAPEYARADVCDFLFTWAEPDPPDPIRFYASRMEVEPLLAGRAPGRLRGGPAAPTGESDRHPSLSRILDVLDRMIAVNPVPEHLGNWDPGKLPEAWQPSELADFVIGFSTSARGVIDPEAVVRTIGQAVAADKQTGLLPAAPGGSLEARWGYPPAERVVSRGLTTHTLLDQAGGRVWPTWSAPADFHQFDYDDGGSVLLHDAENYVGSSTFLARVDDLERVRDRYEEIYALELPRVEFSDPRVRLELDAASGRGSVPDDTIAVHVALDYEVAGIKDLRTSVELETVYWDGDVVRVAATPDSPLRPTSDTEVVSPIPLLVVEACTVAGHPYEPLSRVERGVSRQQWGADGVGDDWGTRVDARDIGVEAAGRTGCRSCVETQLHFRVPKSLLANGSLAGTCSVHLYAHQPWEVAFRVPVGRVDVGTVRRGSPR